MGGKPAPGPVGGEVFSRPTDFGEFVGQPAICEVLRVAIESALLREAPLDHLLFQGLPGLGKTTLAHIVARRLGAQIKTTSGPALTKTGDLAAVLTSLDEGDILFIDEIHRLPKAVEEALYPAMEDWAFDVVVGKGPGARILRLALNRFTLLGATTRMSIISKPLRSRFGLILRLMPYDPLEIAEIVDLYAGRMGMSLSRRGRALLATAGRGVPRTVLALLRRLRDLALVEKHGATVADLDLVQAALDGLGIDGRGLDPMDRKILAALADKNRPLGLRSLALLVQEEETTIADVHEPFLVHAGLIDLTPQGRMLTREGYAAAGKNPPPDLFAG
ncbi:Holliday junction branch migration DNA helicase RuvB [bacterium]|nr:Holliday junction branch migration DNA helicase RuvB [bacterium]